MPQSGIKPTDEVKLAFQQVHKLNSGLPYAVFRFSPDLKNVIVDNDPKFYAKQHHYNDLLALMPSNEPRFIAFEFPYNHTVSGAQTASPILVSWFPSNCMLKLKFLVGATFLGLIGDLGAKKYIEGEDMSELDEKSVCAKFEWGQLRDEQRATFSDAPVDINNVK